MLLLIVATHIHDAVGTPELLVDLQAVWRSLIEDDCAINCMNQQPVSAFCCICKPSYHEASRVPLPQKRCCATETEAY